MINYKEYINLLKNNTCNDCVFFNYKRNHVYAKYFNKGFSMCLSSVACYCETELKRKEEQIINHILKDMRYCDETSVVNRIIDFISKKVNKLEIE